MSRLSRSILALLLALTLISCAKKQTAKLNEPVADEGGPRMKLGLVTFVGNKIFSQGELAGKMTSKPGDRFDDFTFQQDLRKIIYGYQKKGYLEAKFVNREGRVNLQNQSVDYVLTIDEGPVSAIGNIGFDGNSLYADSLLLSALRIKSGDAMNLAAIKQATSGIVGLYAEAGHLYCTVKDTVIKTADPHVADVLFKIYEGPEVHVGTIRISGNKRVRNKVIQREMNLVPGELLVPNRIYENQQKVYSLGLFTEVRFELEGLAEKRDTINLILRIGEDRTNWVGFNFGYQHPSSVQGGLEWGSENVFGNLQKLTVRTDNSYGLQNYNHIHAFTNNYYADYLEPYFLSTPLKASISTFFKRERGEASLWRTLSRLGGEGSVGKNFTKVFQSFVGYKYEYVQETVNTTSDVFLTAVVDSRDSLFNPHHGVNVTARIDQAGSVLGGSNDFQKASGEVAMFHGMGSHLVVAWRVKGAAIRTYGRGGPIPIQERLHLGGAMNLRGYVQDELSADTLATRNLMVCGNLELRFFIVWMVGATVFVDAGNVWSDFTGTKWYQYKGGTGLGLRIYTPIGPIRLDYAVRTDRTIDFKHGQIYINLGHAF